jgi:hypothetical protein
MERGELDRFDGRFGRMPRAFGGAVAPAIGVVLIVVAGAFSWSLWHGIRLNLL